MNALEVILSLYVEEVIDTEELEEQLRNMNVTKISIDRFVKEAQRKRAKVRVRKYHENQQSQNDESEIK